MMFKLYLTGSMRGYEDALTRVRDYQIRESKNELSLKFDIVVVNDVVPPILWGH